MALAAGLAAVGPPACKIHSECPAQWSGISRLHGPSRSGEVQARWCQPWVSARTAIQESTVRFGRPAACNLIRSKIRDFQPLSRIVGLASLISLAILCQALRLTRGYGPAVAGWHEHAGGNLRPVLPRVADAVVRRVS